jgi:midasin
VLLKEEIETKPIPGFVPTQTATQTMHQIAVFLSLRQPILLSGPASSGKDTVLDYFFSTLKTSRHVMKLHLGDSSLDPRSLLGSYISSTKNPGNFEWKDGVIVRAMKEGKFLVLENIDKASSEVLGTIWPLVESLSMAKPIGAHATLQVFGRERVVAKEGFGLFATRTTPHSSEASHTPPTFLGWHKWRQVNLPSLSGDVISLILKEKFSQLGIRLIDAILRTWVRLVGVHNYQIGNIARSLEMRDLMKWCHRLRTYSHIIPSEHTDAMELDSQGPEPLSAVIKNPSLRENIFSDAYDVFLGSLNPYNDASLSRIKASVSILAEDLSISEDRLQYLMTTKTPQLDITRDQNGRVNTVWVDRVRLTAVKRSDSLSDATLTHSFALHRYSLSLLASLAACIHSNEPVLLTGETGTGKTTAITYLASLLSQKLVSFNLSQQTESSDLLGGYKPSDARSSAQSIQNSFRELFMRTFSREKNVKYEEAIRVAVTGGKWKRSVALWREAAKRAQDRIREKDEKMLESQYVFSLSYLQMSLTMLQDQEIIRRCPEKGERLILLAFFGPTSMIGRILNQH